MKCHEPHRDELAEKYLNGQLDPAAQDDFEIHILECAQCLRRVEVNQTLRQELAERAYQIRAYSQVERSRFRWHWATVAAFSLVLCGLGAVELRRMKAPRPIKLQVQPSASATSNPNDVAPASNSSHASSVPTDNLPVNGRTYVNFTITDSRVSRGNAPSIGSPPSSGLNVKGQGAGSKLAAMDTSGAAANSTSRDHSSVPRPVTASGQTPPVPEKRQAPVVASDETAKELFRLGTVQAPPYTFSGVASSSGHDAVMDPGALSGKSRTSPAHQPRPFFRDAMDAYVDRRYADASDLLEQAAQAEPNAPDVNFYLGVCRLLEAKPADSVTPLQSVLADEKSRWAQAAHFYLAKAYLQTGDLVQAEAHLQAAADMAGRLRAEAGAELTRLQAVRAREEKQNRRQAPKP